MTTTRLVKSRPPAAAIIVISFRGQLLAYLRCGHVSRTRVCNPQTNFVISSRARASYGPSRPLYEMQSVFPSASCGTGSHDTRQFTRENRTNWLARTLDNKSPYFILFYPFPSGKSVDHMFAFPVTPSCYCYFIFPILFC